MLLGNIVAAHNARCPAEFMYRFQICIDKLTSRLRAQGRHVNPVARQWQKDIVAIDVNNSPLSLLDFLLTFKKTNWEKRNWLAKVNYSKS